MRTRTLVLVAIFGAGVLGAARYTAVAADWPQWRGPQRTGISAETGLLKQWPADGPKLVWQIHDLGDGYSTPSVVGDRLYVISNEGKDDEFVLALAVDDGHRLWKTSIGKVGVNKGPQYPGSRSTPTCDGDRLYALGSDGDLACLDRAAGTVRWQKKLRSDFGGDPGVWAYAESPLIDGDLLVCTPGGNDATLVALDKLSGEVVWKSPVPDGDKAGYASIIVLDVGGVKQYVQFLGKGLVGVEAKTGKFLWRYDKTAKGSAANIPTPVAHDGFVYSATRSGGGLVQIKPAAGGVEAQEVYFEPKLPNGIGGSVMIDRYLYGTTGAGLLCVEFATGKVMWQDRSVGAASVCFADGRLYVHGDKDEMALVEPSPEAYRERGRFTLPAQPDRGKSQSWTYPIVANGRLYVRDLGALWSYDVQESPAGN